MSRVNKHDPIHYVVATQASKSVVGVCQDLSIVYVVDLRDWLPGSLLLRGRSGRDWWHLNLNLGRGDRWRLIKHHAQRIFVLNLRRLSVALVFPFVRDDRHRVL